MSMTINDGWARNAPLLNGSGTNGSATNGSAMNGSAMNHSTLIHFLHYSDPSKPATIPLIVIPGMIQSAEDVAASMGGCYANPTIFISLRGRGNSESPPSYSFEDHLSDIAAVADHLKLSYFGILGISTGAAFALGYAAWESRRSAHALQSSRIRYMILHDYPPVYPALTPEWGEEVQRMESNRISSYALPRIIADSRTTVLVPALADIPCPVLITRGDGSDVLLSDMGVDLYAEGLPDCMVERLPGMGHDPFTSSLFFEAVVRGFTSTVSNPVTTLF